MERAETDRLDCRTRLTGITGSNSDDARYREAWGKDTSDLGEYDYAMRGSDVYINAESKAENDRGGRIWREGLQKYPNSALLKVKLGWYHWTAAWQFWSDDMTADFDEAGRLVREALATDNLSPEVRRSASWLNAYFLMRQGDFFGAVEQAEATVALAPYDARVRGSLPDVLLAAGEYQTALDWLDIAEKRNPARVGNIQASRANIFRLMGRYDEAIAAFGSLGNLQPYMRLSAAIAHVRLGQIAQAEERVREAMEIDPQFTRTLWREGSFYSDAAILDAEIADLAAAGLPEQWGRSPTRRFVSAA